MSRTYLFLIEQVGWQKAFKSISE